MFDAQEVVIHASSIGGETSTFRFHGGAQVRCLRMAIKRAASTEQTSYLHGLPFHSKEQKQRVRLVNDGTELKDDSVTLSDIGFSAEQPTPIMSILEGANADNILKHFYVPIEKRTDKIDILCDIYGRSHHAWQHEAADTIVICSQRYEVVCIAYQMARRGFFVWKIAEEVILSRYGYPHHPQHGRTLDSTANMRIHDYNPDTYRSGHNRMIIINDDELEDLYLPEGVRVFINYNAGEGPTSFCGGIYPWNFSRFSDDHAIVIDFVTAKDVGMMKRVEDVSQIKIEQFRSDIMEHLIKDTCILHALSSGDDESLFSLRDTYSWKWPRLGDPETAARLGVCRPQEAMRRDMDRSTNDLGAFTLNDRDAPASDPSYVPCPKTGPSSVIASMRCLASSVTSSLTLMIMKIQVIMRSIVLPAKYPLG